jgi:tetratricopeptide (TPR) repeat protein
MPRRAVAAAGAAAGVLAAISFLLPWLAEREVRDAAAIWRTDPQAAYDGLDRAAALNPLSSRPRLVAGALAFRLGHVSRARESFADAVARDPGNAYALLELGLAEALAGRRDTALRHLRAARRADPADLLTRDALAVVRRGRRPDVGAINGLIAGRARDRLR